MYNNLSFIKPRPGIQLNRAHPLARGLVGYWPLNERSGSKTYDVSGSGHGTLTNFTLSGSISNWIGSPMGGGLSFDTNDYINAGNQFAFSCTSTSICGWIKLTTVTGNQVIFHNGTGGSNGWGCYVGGTEFYYLKEALISCPAGVTLSVGVWYNFVWVVDSLNNPSLYLNGNYVSTYANTTATNAATNQKYIGTNTGTSNYFNGVIDEVRIYNRVLHPDEIQTLYVNPHIDFHGSKTRLLAGAI